jgi:transcriptional regulator with XRE-family HTH domain
MAKYKVMAATKQRAKPEGPTIRDGYDWGFALTTAREGARMRQIDAARALSVSATTIGNWERGVVPKDFVEKHLPRLARLYRFPVEFLVASAEEPQPPPRLEAADIPWYDPIGPPHVELMRAHGRAMMWFGAFLKAIAALVKEDPTRALAVERARRQLTFAQVDLWAGGNLDWNDDIAVRNAMARCVTALWRNLTDPGWIDRPQSDWKQLPPPFAHARDLADRPVGFSRIWVRNPDRDDRTS